MGAITICAIVELLSHNLVRGSIMVII